MLTGWPFRSGASWFEKHAGVFQGTPWCWCCYCSLHGCLHGAACVDSAHSSAGHSSLMTGTSLFMK